MARRRSTSGITKLRIGGAMSPQQVEEAIGAAGGVSKSGASAELTRVDYLPDETVVYYRGDRAADAAVRKTLKAAAPKAKLQGKRVAVAALKKAL